MEPWLIAIILRPFAALLILGAALGARFFIDRWMPDGWLKHQLLVERFHSPASHGPRRKRAKKIG